MSVQALRPRRPLPAFGKARPQTGQLGPCSPRTPGAWLPTQDSFIFSIVRPDARHSHRERAAKGRAVKLEVRDLRRAAWENTYRWRPFEPNQMFNPDWWDRPRYNHRDPHCIAVFLDGTEVARVELDHHFRGSRHAGAPRLGDLALEIQFIEVAASHRRRGIGSEVVRLLVERYPHRRLLAMSEDADGFWESLGWGRYDHRQGPQWYRPLFVAPE